MNESDYRKYMDAVDIVCLRCCYTTGDECERCMVRKTVDKMNEKRQEAMA